MNNVGLNMAATVAANSFFIGGNWGFIINTNPDYEKIKGIVKSDSNVKTLEAENGLIVMVHPQYLHNVISQVEQIGPDVLSKHQTRAKEEVVTFQNYLLNILKGRVKGNKNLDYEEYVFAIYSCNNLHKLRLNGIEYPAFSITELEAITEINKMRKFADVYFAVENGFENADKLSGNNDVNRVIKGLEISPTMNGVFMTIRMIRKV